MLFYTFKFEVVSKPILQLLRHSIYIIDCYNDVNTSFKKKNCSSHLFIDCYNDVNTSFKKKKLFISFIVQNEVAFGSVNGKFLEGTQTLL